MKQKNKVQNHRGDAIYCRLTKDNLKNFITETLKYQFLKKDASESDDEYYFKKTNNNKLKNTRKSKIKKIKLVNLI